MRFDRLPAFVPLATRDDAIFRAGLLRVAGRKSLGVLRIGVFLHQAYADVCRDAAAEAGIAPEQPSNERRGGVPDRIVPWAPSDSAYQRAQKALDAVFAASR